jgi:flagellum-specific peptidoglycan hydrolase FlgJ
MKKTLFAILVVLLSVFCMADTPQKSYIEKYSDLAIEEMYRTGVPASITLAQGLLESGYGLSELAVKGNNHFGIKCHNTWTGAKVYHDDDRKGECFRKYDSP